MHNLLRKDLELEVIGEISLDVLSENEQKTFISTLLNLILEEKQKIIEENNEKGE